MCVADDKIVANVYDQDTVLRYTYVANVYVQDIVLRYTYYRNLEERNRLSDKNMISSVQMRPLLG